MKLFDSHCHLQDPRISEDLHSVMNRASMAGVSAMLCCGTSEQDWDKVIESHRSMNQLTDFEFILVYSYPYRDG